VKFSDFQASSTFELDGVIMSACEKCRMDHAERTPPATPPCESCRVQLVTENEDAARIYMTVRGQKLSSGELNHLAVWAAIDGYGIKDRAGTFEKVMATHYGMMKERRDDGATEI
jgi:hypothetical protein